MKFYQTSQVYSSRGPKVILTKIVPNVIFKFEHLRSLNIFKIFHIMKNYFQFDFLIDCNDFRRRILEQNCILSLIVKLFNSDFIWLYWITILIVTTILIVYNFSMIKFLLTISLNILTLLIRLMIKEKAHIHNVLAVKPSGFYYSFYSREIESFNNFRKQNTMFIE